MKRAAMLIAIAAIAGGVELSAPQMTAEEMSGFQTLAQEQRINAAELRAAQAEQGRLNEIAIRLYTQACADRDITAKDFQKLREVCNVDLEKRSVTRRDPVPPAKK